MKYLYRSIFVLVLSVAFIACGDDGNDKSENNVSTNSGSSTDYGICGQFVEECGDGTLSAQMVCGLQYDHKEECDPLFDEAYSCQLDNDCATDPCEPKMNEAARCFREGGSSSDG